ncbi:hypothetical protein OOT33_13655 [Sphingobium sp. DEHP117]|uniref:hypothetical protein n=1 Tax=Sphingobium sp. DEHP117 TaxID=2993436 RepID=UPI0027D63428|nr:hypothetical protein [Sphingobium sp. DEHP117]MDQ4421468.1 hypothetical protein [Sphingobium sp. DEHP117]
MADAAITKVLAAIKALVETPSLTFHINRTDDNPLDESELPGVIVRVPHMAFEDYGSQGGDMVRATLHFDFCSSGSAGETIDQENQRNVADTMKRMASDRTLGGMVHRWEAAAVSGSEQDGADVGTAILETEIVFFTLRDDPFVIVGLTGAHF